MTIDRSIYRRVLRRETHPSRSAPAVTLAVIVCLLALAVSALGLWWLFDLNLRSWMEQSGAQAVQMLDGTLFLGVPLGNLLIAAGGVLALALGIVLLALAVLPGRRPRRGRSGARCAVLVDDGVLADAMADAVAARCGLDARQVQVTVRRRSALIRVTPTSGVPVDSEAVLRAAHDSGRDIGFDLAIRVRVLEKGVLA